MKESRPGSRPHRRWRAASRAVLAAMLAVVATSATLHAAGSPRDTSSTLRELDDQARESAPLYRSRLAGDFLHAVSRLPTVAPRTVLFDSSRVHYWTSGQAAALPDSQRARLISRELGESFYYNTRYGTPLAYARPLELLAKAGFTRVAGRRLADFGYGGIGQLRLLATLGAEVTGIEVDPLLRALYSWPNDQGQIAGAKPPGSLSLVSGQWPAAPELVREVGNGYDLFISKNTLKNGYLHPAEPVDPRRLVHLGVEDSTFAAALYRVLRPGGWAMIYNLCPAPAPPGMPYIPWADGRCPFSRAMLEAAGFQVVAFDADDSPAARRMGHALGWDDPDGAKMDLEHDLFATYTLLRRPPKP